jgi:hypothetical protein
VAELYEPSALWDKVSELGDADVLVPFFSKSHKEEKGKTQQRDKQKDPTQKKVRSVRRLIHILVYEPGTSPKADYSYKQKRILHGPSSQR